MKPLENYKRILERDDNQNGINKPSPLNSIRKMVRTNVSYYLSESVIASLLKQHPKLLKIYKNNKELTKLVNKILIRQLGQAPTKVSLINLKDLLLIKAKRIDLTLNLKEVSK